MACDEYQLDEHDPDMVGVNPDTTTTVAEVLADIEAVLTQISPTARAEIDTILARADNHGGLALLIDQVQFTRCLLTHEADTKTK